MKIILGSSSVNRKELFERLGVQFEIVEPDFEEVLNLKISNQQNIKNFALGKALSVHEKIEKKETGDFCILGFDSMVEFEKEVIGKPKTKTDAFNMIQRFVGKSQKIVSGIACVGRWKGKYFEIVETESTKIWFKKETTNCQIRDYLAFDDWKGKCGSYSILGTGTFLLEKIEGDFQNIIGVPVIRMGNMIRKITGKSPLKVFEKK